MELKISYILLYRDCLVKHGILGLGARLFKVMEETKAGENV